MVIWHSIRRHINAGAMACVVLLAAPVAGEASMSFKVVPLGDAAKCGDACPLVIQADGEIVDGTAERFVSFAQGNIASGRLKNVVFIQSPGGTLYGSIKLGATFRSLGTTVVVARIRERSADTQTQVENPRRRGQFAVPTADLSGAYCNSGCVYAVMGGRKRVIPPQSRMGVHRMQGQVVDGYDPVSRSLMRRYVNGSDTTVSALKRYTAAMGIRPQLIDVAESIPHSTVKVLSRDEINRFRLGSERF